MGARKTGIRFAARVTSIFQSVREGSIMGNPQRSMREDAIILKLKFSFIRSMI